MSDGSRPTPASLAPDPIRVLVVDDSAVVRRLVTELLTADPGIEVVGTASNGRAALAKVERLHPDLVTMDLHMPVMDGIEAVRHLGASGSRIPVIMLSTLTERGAVATLDAIAAGAADYVCKPTSVGSTPQSLDQVREELIPRIKALVPRRSVSASTAPVHGRSVPAVPLRRPSRRPGRPGLLVIGCSTGGPEALTTLLEGLPVLPVPVVVVQHLPPVFTRLLATRLDHRLEAEVREIRDGEPLTPGTIGIAPGAFHVAVRLHGTALEAHLHQEPPENSCRPAVDVLFRSAAAAMGDRVLAVVLTGMGRDGAKGAADIVAAGGSVLVQDRSSSVVWGMPGTVARAGLAEAVLALNEMAPELVRRLCLPGPLGDRSAS